MIRYSICGTRFYKILILEYMINFDISFRPGGMHISLYMHSILNNHIYYSKYE